MTDVLDQVENTTTVIELSWSTLVRLASITASASDDDARPILTNVHVIESGGKLQLDATDSYTLARFVTEIDAPQGLDVLIPAKWLVTAVKQTKVTRAPETTLTISFTGDNVTISNRDVTLTSAVGWGTFPSVDQLIPSEKDYLNELGAFDAWKLARMGAILPPEDRKRDANSWKCLSMSLNKPSVWTRYFKGIDAQFLIMPYRMS